MGNHERRFIAETVHLYVALCRKKDNEESKRCIRVVVKDEETLPMLEGQLKAIGGEWRIHKTVNARSVEKARKIFLKTLIDYPERASYADSEWRTCLLNRSCRAEKKFMLDVDSKSQDDLRRVGEILVASDLKQLQYDVIETPNGWHIVSEIFDTREVLKLPYVSLLRDGFHFVKKVA